MTHFKMKNLKKKVKKSDSSSSSAESEGSGLDLKVYDIYNQRMRKDETVGTLRPNFTKGSRSGFILGYSRANKKNKDGKIEISYHEKKIFGALKGSTGNQRDFVVSGRTTTTNTPAKSTEKDSVVVHNLQPRRADRPSLLKNPKAGGSGHLTKEDETYCLEGANQQAVEFGTKEASSLKETSGKFPPQKYPTMTSSQLASLVRVFPLRDNVEAFKTSQGELFSSRSAECYEIKDQNTYSLRMLRDYFLTTRAEPSQSYSFRWMNLGMMRNGRCLTLSIGCPRTGRGSLSSVLEEKVDEKYYLKKDYVDKMIEYNKRQEKHGRGFRFDPKTDEMNALKVGGEGKDNVICEGLQYEGAILSEQNKKWLEDGKELSRNFPQGQRVYSDKGIASSICGDAGGLGGKTGLYLIRPCLTPDRVEKRQHGRRFKEHEEEMFTLTKQDIHGVQENRRIRRLTPRECERLQGFPDDFSAEGDMGKISDTQRYKMMGNAVSVPVIDAIGKRIIEVFHG